MKYYLENQQQRTTSINTEGKRILIVKITINGKEYEVSENKTILNTCQKLNIHIPNLCYLKGFSPTGACGLCAVEVEDIGVVLACKTVVKDGMNINTDSTKVHSIRKLNIDRLLKRHHINCFNCLKNGMCKFQEYTFNIYHDSPEKLKLDTDKLDKNDKITSDLYYNEEKCINCMKCLKFLNAVCDYSLKSVKDLQTIDTGKCNVLLNIPDICPTVALSIKTEVPGFICDKIETYDINDVFAPKIKIFKYNNKIVDVNSIDVYINDKTRIELMHLPNREFLDDIYKEAIKNVTQRILSNAHELNIFVVGDNIDLITFSYLKILSEKFNNIRLCFNDFNIPNNLALGLKRSDLISMEFIFFLGDISHIDKLKFALNQNKFRKSLLLNINELNFKGLSTENFSKARYPYLIIFSNIFRKYDSSFVLEKIKKFKEDYFNKFGVNLNIGFIPQNLSQMLVFQANNYMPMDDLFSKFNKHDILSLCIIGDTNYELKIPVGIYAISNSVFNFPNCIHIPSKHYTEDEGYYINIFNELLKTKNVINNNLKSNREFLFDLMQNIFGNDFDSINHEAKQYIRNNFFKKYDFTHF